MIGRRYLILDLIGSGGMGTVMRALDRLTDTTVALKQVNPPERRQALADLTDSSALRLALAGEFRLLASLHHPNVIGVLDYGFVTYPDGTTQPYYTMELLENAYTLIEAGTGQPLETQIELLSQLLQALAYLHRRKVIHRDLKPSNILVQNQRVKVLDFGLSMIDGERSEPSGTTVGTLAYLAPEVLTGGDASIASDLYAVGVLAYEMVAGIHPFNIQDPGRMIMQVLRDLPDLTPLPDNLSIFIYTLMSKDPTERYESAEATLHALYHAVGLPPPRETVEIRDSFLQTAPLIGRNDEFELLTRALSQALAGHGSAWLIGGESGVGKSRLLDEIAVQAMVQGALVMRGEGVPQGALPYHHWRTPLRWLSLLNDLSKDEVATLSVILPDIGEMLLQEPDSPPLASMMGMSLYRLVTRMLSQVHQPILLILEDLHWAGSDTLQIMRQIMPLVKDLPLLIIGSYRDDEMPTLPSLLPETQHVKLKRLGGDDIAALSAAILGEPGQREGVVNLLQRETEGNVFFLIEVIRALAEEAGQLDHIGSLTLPAHIFAGGVQQVIQRRLLRVPLAAAPLLHLAATAGRQVDLRLMHHLAPHLDLENWLAICANAAVLEMTDGVWRFAHEKLREGLLEPLDPPTRAELHRQVAVGVEAVDPDPAQHAAALAYHWMRAGEISRCLDYTLIAGDTMLRSGIYREALELFDQAQRMTHDLNGDPLLAAQTRLREADAHLGLGQYAEAHAILTENLRFYLTLSRSDGLINTYQRLGDIAYAFEDFELAEAHYQQALTLAQQMNDSQSTAAALNSLGNVAFDLDQEDKATQLFQASLALRRADGESWGIAGSIAQHDETDDG
jgi:serine/threonine protein kinase/tetratricopeptide (TPR) repeat protein